MPLGYWHPTLGIAWVQNLWPSAGFPNLVQHRVTAMRTYSVPEARTADAIRWTRNSLQCGTRSSVRGKACVSHVQGHVASTRCPQYSAALTLKRSTTSHQLRAEPGLQYFCTKPGGLQDARAIFILQSGRTKRSMASTCSTSSGGSWHPVCGVGHFPRNDAG